MSFSFNRKKAAIELEIQQTMSTGNDGLTRYRGQAVVWLQEIDGAFSHMVQIEDLLSKHELPCHSKTRRYLSSTADDAVL